MKKVGGEDEAEWLVKDISTCVLSGDPECALAWGEVEAPNLSFSEFAKSSS